MKGCPVCECGFNGTGKYCSPSCSDEMMDIVSIVVPVGWVNKTLLRSKSAEDTILIIDSFAKRHQYDKKLLMKKLRITFNYRLG